MKPLCSIVLLSLVAGPAFAGETPWQEVMPGVAIRLLATDAITEAETTWVALEIDMPDTVKTYWRVPGESGIPPHFDFSGSTGIGDHTVSWPYPTRSEAAAYLDHAYYGYTVLPIEVEVNGERPMIALDATLGICSDVCVPVSAAFSLEIDPATPDRPNMVRMEQARAEAPIAWDGPEVIGEITYLPGEGVLVAALNDPGFPRETAIADIAGMPLLFGPPELAAAPDALRFPLMGRTVAEPAEGGPVHITFMGADGPYEIVRPLRIGGSSCESTMTIC